MLPALLALGSSMLQSGASIYNTRMTNDANRELAEYSYARDLEQWNRANAYNDPTAQMSRLKAAGLNPAMIYGGQGGGAAGAAAPSPSYKPPKAEYNVQAPDLLAFQQARLLSAQTDNVQAQTANLESRTRNEAIRGFVMDTGIEESKSRIARNNQALESGAFSLERDRELLPYQLKGAQLQNEATETEIRRGLESILNMGSERALNELKQKELSQNIRFASQANPSRQALLALQVNEAEWNKMTQGDRLQLLQRQSDKLVDEAIGIQHENVMREFKNRLAEQTGTTFSDQVLVRLVAITMRNIGVSAEQAIQYLKNLFE